MTLFGRRAAASREGMAPLGLLTVSIAEVIHQWEETNFHPGVYVSEDGTATLAPRCMFTSNPSYILHASHEVSSDIWTDACMVVGVKISLVKEIPYTAELDSCDDCGTACLIIIPK